MALGEFRNSDGQKSKSQERKLNLMLYWAVVFFVIALLAAILGFTGIALAAAGIAKILFVVFLVLFLASLVGHTMRRL